MLAAFSRPCGYTCFVADIIIAIFAGLLAAATGYLGMYVTLHPPDNPTKIFRCKIAFVFNATLACILIGLQAYRSVHASTELKDYISSEGTAIKAEIHKEGDRPFQPIIQVPPAVVIREEGTSLPATTSSLPQEGFISNNIAPVKGHPELNDKTVRTNIRDRLETFLKQGASIQWQLGGNQDLSDLAASEKVENWKKTVTKFLGDHFGPEYITWFRSNQDVPEAVIQPSPIIFAPPKDKQDKLPEELKHVINEKLLPNTKTKEDLWRDVFSRRFRLQQLLVEFKDNRQD